MFNKLHPSQTLTFYEMLVFIGCKESDALFYSEVYDKYSEAVDIPDFVDMLISIGMDLNYISEFSLIYFDIELGMNVDISELKDSNLYLVEAF